MRVVSAKRDGNTVKLEIETPFDAIVAAQDGAFKRLVKSAKIPGFRPGKAPRSIYEKYYGKSSLIQEAVLDAVNDAYQAAVRDQDLKVIDMPKNVDISEYEDNKPVLFKCEVEVVPEVKLGKYTGIKLKKDATEVSDDTLNEQITAKQEMYAEYLPVEHEVQDGDIIRCDIQATIDGVTYETWSRSNMGLKVGTAQFGPDVDKEVIGLKKGDSKDITSTFADDYSNPDVAGKTVAFSLTLVEVLERKLAELTPEFIEKVSKFKSLEEWKSSIRAELETKASQAADEKLKADLMDAILADIKMDVPTVLVEREIDHMLRLFDRQMRQSGMSFEAYLTYAGKKIEEVREEVRESAEKRVKTELALDAVAQKENIVVDDEEFDAEVLKWQLPNVASLEDFRKTASTLDVENIRDSIRIKKTYDYLLAQAKIS